MFSTLQAMNKHKMKTWEAQMADASFMWNFAVRLATAQDKAGSVFILEHPARATSWGLPSTKALLEIPGVTEVCFDECSLGLKCPGTGEPLQKRTRLATNSERVKTIFTEFQCECKVKHRCIQGRAGGIVLSTFASHYPKQMCEVLAKAAQDIAGCV